MKFHELVAALSESPATFPRFVLPDGNYIPAQAHITEVGHVIKDFIDCGGAAGRTESVLLQTHVGNDADHRLKSDRFARILQLGRRVLPTGEFDVEVEYDCCVVSQYPITQVKSAGEYFEILLGRKQTRCLAQERSKQEAAEACCAAATTCC